MNTLSVKIQSHIAILILFLSKIRQVVQVFNRNLKLKQTYQMALLVQAHPNVCLRIALHWFALRGLYQMDKLVIILNNARQQHVSMGHAKSLFNLVKPVKQDNAL